MRNITNQLAIITVQPGLTNAGEPTTNINETISYKLINSTDNYGIIIQIEESITKEDSTLISHGYGEGNYGEGAYG